MDPQLKAIHTASMKILENTGIKIHHQEILKIAEKHGIKVSGDIIYFQEDQIIKWIGKAPKHFTVMARNPKYNMVIGGENTEFAPGYGCPTIIEIDGSKRTAVYNDYCTFLKLVHQSDFFNINGGLVVQPSDLEAKHYLPLMIYTSIIHSDKCLMGIPGSTFDVLKTMDLAGIVFGQNTLLENPRILTLINSTSPLQFDRIALETMMVCTYHNQPLIISPGPMAGATGPVTLAGNLALGNAETLAGVALTQMINAGSPVIYGLQPTTLSMQSASVSIGSPGCALEMVYAARLAKAYGLPSRCGGANTDAKCMSAQSGFESMMSLFSVCVEKPNFVLHSAGVLDGYGAMSYEQFIIDLEILSMIKFYMEGINVGDDALAVDLINKVGPGGEFLTSLHTLENCRSAVWTPEISLGGVVPEKKHPDQYFLEKIINKKNRLLEEYRKPDIDPGIKSDLMNYLENEINIDRMSLKKVG